MLITEDRLKELLAEELIHVEGIDEARRWSRKQQLQSAALRAGKFLEGALAGGESTVPAWSYNNPKNTGGVLSAEMQTILRSSPNTKHHILADQLNLLDVEIRVSEHVQPEMRAMAEKYAGMKGVKKGTKRWNMAFQNFLSRQHELQYRAIPKRKTRLAKLAVKFDPSGGRHLGRTTQTNLATIKGMNEFWSQFIPSIPENTSMRASMDSEIRKILRDGGVKPKILSSDPQPKGPTIRAGAEVFEPPKLLEIPSGNRVVGGVERPLPHPGESPPKAAAKWAQPTGFTKFGIPISVQAERGVVPPREPLNAAAHRWDKWYEANQRWLAYEKRVGERKKAAHYHQQQVKMYNRALEHYAAATDYSYAKEVHEKWSQMSEKAKIKHLKTKFPTLRNIDKGTLRLVAQKLDIIMDDMLKSHNFFADHMKTRARMRLAWSGNNPATVRHSHFDTANPADRRNTREWGLGPDEKSHTAGEGVNRKAQKLVDNIKLQNPEGIRSYARSHMNTFDPGYPQSSGKPKHSPQVYANAVKHADEGGAKRGSKKWNAIFRRALGGLGVVVDVFFVYNFLKNCLDSKTDEVDIDCTAQLLTGRSLSGDLEGHERRRAKGRYTAAEASAIKGWRRGRADCSDDAIKQTNVYWCQNKACSIEDWYDESALNRCGWKGSTSILRLIDKKYKTSIECLKGEYGDGNIKRCRDRCDPNHPMNKEGVPEWCAQEPDIVNAAQQKRLQDIERIRAGTARRAGTGTRVHENIERALIKFIDDELHKIL